jgi:hypothetical protein
MFSKRHGAAYGRAPAGRTPDLERSAERGEAISHVMNADSSPVRSLEAGAVVGHPEDESAGGGKDRNAHAGIWSVLCGVLESLASDEVKGGLDARFEPSALERWIDLKFRSRTPTTNVFAQSHCDTPVGKELRKYAACQVTQGLENLAGLCAEVVQAGRRTDRVLFDQLAGCTEAKGQDNELLLRTIVDVALNPASFGILGGQHALPG